jgi:hypothetical protein
MMLPMRFACEFFILAFGRQIGVVGDTFSLTVP